MKDMIDGLYGKQTTASRVGNSSLKKLNLSNNKLNGEGAKYFVEILENDTNTSL